MHLILHPEPLEEGLLRHCDALPDLFAQGETSEESVERAGGTTALKTEGLPVLGEERHPRAIIVKVVA